MSVASRRGSGSRQAVIVSSDDSDNDSEDLRTLSARVGGTHARKRASAPAAGSRPGPASSTQQRGCKRARPQDVSPGSAARRRRTQQEQQSQQGGAAPSQARHRQHSRLQQEAIVDLTSLSDSEDDLVIVGSSGPSRHTSGHAAARGRRPATTGPLLQQGVPLLALRTPVRAPPVPDVVTSPKGPACAVCMEKLREPSCGPCGHIFCKACLHETIKKLKKCPTCRRGFQIRQIHRVFLPDEQ